MHVTVNLVVRFMARYETSTRFISNPIRASFQGLSLEIYKYARQICLQQGRNTCKCLLIFTVAVGFSRCGGWERALPDNTRSTSSTSCQLGAQTALLSSEGNIKSTFDTVLHRLGLSISCWKKPFFHESVDVRMCWAEVKINKRVKSNTDRLTGLTKHTLFLFLPLVPQDAPSCIWTQDAR